MENNYKKHVAYIMYTLIVVILFSLLFWFGKFNAFRDFMNSMEQNSFDIRQSIISLNKQADNNIAILAIDDATYEYIMDKYVYKK